MSIKEIAKRIKENPNLWYFKCVRCGKLHKLSELGEKH